LPNGIDLNCFERCGKSALRGSELSLIGSFKQINYVCDAISCLLMDDYKKKLRKKYADGLDNGLSSNDMTAGSVSSPYILI
jgi:rRNA processing protein Krr1/Pno1